MIDMDDETIIEVIGRAVLDIAEEMEKFAQDPEEITALKNQRLGMLTIATRLDIRSEVMEYVEKNKRRA